MEAIWPIDVVDFPAFILVDGRGERLLLVTQVIQVCGPRLLLRSGSVTSRALPPFSLGDFHPRRHAGPLGAPRLTPFLCNIHATKSPSNSPTFSE